MSEWQEFLFENGTKYPLRAWEDMRNMGNRWGVGWRDSQQPWVQSPTVSQTRWYTPVIRILGRQRQEGPLTSMAIYSYWIGEFQVHWETVSEKIDRNRRYSMVTSGLYSHTKWGKGQVVVEAITYPIISLLLIFARIFPRWNQSLLHSIFLKTWRFQTNLALSI